MKRTKTSKSSKEIVSDPMHTSPDEPVSPELPLPESFTAEVSVGKPLTLRDLLVQARVPNVDATIAASPPPAKKASLSTVVAALSRAAEDSSSSSSSSSSNNNAGSNSVSSNLEPIPIPPQFALPGYPTTTVDLTSSMPVLSPNVAPSAFKPVVPTSSVARQNPDERFQVPNTLPSFNLSTGQANTPSASYPPPFFATATPSDFSKLFALAAGSVIPNLSSIPAPAIDFSKIFSISANSANTAATFNSNPSSELARLLAAATPAAASTNFSLAPSSRPVAPLNAAAPPNAALPLNAAPPSSAAPSNTTAPQNPAPPLFPTAPLNPNAPLSAAALVNIATPAAPNNPTPSSSHRTIPFTFNPPQPPTTNAPNMPNSEAPARCTLGPAPPDLSVVNETRNRVVAPRIGYRIGPYSIINKVTSITMCCEIFCNPVSPTISVPPVVSTILIHSRNTMLLAAADRRIPYKQAIYKIRHPSLFPEPTPLITVAAREGPNIDPGASITAQVGLAFQVRPILDIAFPFQASLVLMY